MPRARARGYTRDTCTRAYVRGHDRRLHVRCLEPTEKRRVRRLTAAWGTPVACVRSVSEEGL